MSHNHPPHSGYGNIPVSEVYWNLVSKADKKFSKIRDLPYYQRTRYDTYFYKVFKVYTQLWKFQQENRQKLVEAGIKRWEIGEIASRIGQLYFGQYMRTGEANYLAESYIFYEAILTREYFKDGLYQDVSLASKQLRFFARFLTVCLVSNRREMVYQLVNQLKMLLDECRRTFQETDFKEWKIVIQEIMKFLKADTAFMNLRPLRYSVVLDLHPDCLPHVTDVKRKLRLKDALVCSYHPNEVKFAELTLDTFRMLQNLEWEPSGSFYQANLAPSTGLGSGAGQNGASGPSRVNQDITDPTLPPNPRKAILFRPSVTHFMAVLGTVCEELPSDGILLIYLSASGNSSHVISSPTRAGSSIGYTESLVRGFQYHSINSDSSPTSPGSDSTESTDHSGYAADCLHIGPHGPGGATAHEETANLQLESPNARPGEIRRDNRPTGRTATGCIAENARPGVLCLEESPDWANFLDSPHAFTCFARPGVLKLIIARPGELSDLCMLCQFHPANFQLPTLINFNTNTI
ncbi:protein SCAI-like isoform X3 [Salvia splendens]|uniref:protein SCAI-like isoform X3 n=1 Tax=Salvia splendens TaxID=180675 RepID=UPI001C277343|nr:protein SCAI-like isoform X3 [Salvia splendens]